MKVKDYEEEIGRYVKGMKIGIKREYSVDGMKGEIEEIWKKGIKYMKDEGEEIVDI